MSMKMTLPHIAYLMRREPTQRTRYFMAVELRAPGVGDEET